MGSTGVSKECWAVAGDPHSREEAIESWGESLGSFGVREGPGDLKFVRNNCCDVDGVRGEVGEGDEEEKLVVEEVRFPPSLALGGCR